MLQEDSGNAAHIAAVNAAAAAAPNVANPANPCTVSNRMTAADTVILGSASVNTKLPVLPMSALVTSGPPASVEKFTVPVMFAMLTFISGGKTMAGMIVTPRTVIGPTVIDPKENGPMVTGMPLSLTTPSSVAS